MKLYSEIYPDYLRGAYPFILNFTINVDNATFSIHLDNMKDALELSKHFAKCSNEIVEHISNMVKMQCAENDITLGHQIDKQYPEGYAGEEK